MSQKLEKDPRTEKILAALKVRPKTTVELAKEIDYSETTALRFIGFLLEQNFIERIPDSAYYQLTEDECKRLGVVYPSYETEQNISNIPRFYFSKLPIIERWAQLAIGNESRLQNIGDFQNICYGEIVSNFKIHPSAWKHPETSEKFYRMYKMQYGAEMPANTIKAIRAFLSVCLHVNLDANRFEAEYLGLVVKHNAGKYRFIQLLPDEEVQARQWLSTIGLDEAKKNGLDPEGLLGHYAIATEAFPRPSRVLAVEVSRVSFERGLLHWTMWETKQSEEWPKFVKDPQLVEWARKWFDKRRYNKFRYSFLNDNNYESEKYESNKLSKEREPYANVYKEMFKAIGKTENIYYKDTLYCLRHIGVLRWAKRLQNRNGILLIQQMGWTDTRTLLKYYLGMRPADMLDEISIAN